MRKQFAKGFTMFMLAMSVALVTAVVSANAQSRKARATVPFEFAVGDKILPAGNYNVDAITADGQVLRVGNTATAQSANRLTMQAEGTSKGTKLVFHCYGGRYFLTQVWTGAREPGRELAMSKQEKAIQKEAARIAALRHQAPRPTYETVEIATTMN